MELFQTLDEVSDTNKASFRKNDLRDKVHLILLILLQISGKIFKDFLVLLFSAQLFRYIYNGETLYILFLILWHFFAGLSTYKSRQTDEMENKSLLLCHLL